MFKKNFRLFLCAERQSSPHLCLRASMADYRRESWLLNSPLYALSALLLALGQAWKG